MTFQQSAHELRFSLRSFRHWSQTNASHVMTENPKKTRTGPPHNRQRQHSAFKFESPSRNETRSSVDGMSGAFGRVEHGDKVGSGRRGPALRGEPNRRALQSLRLRHNATASNRTPPRTSCLRCKWINAIAFDWARTRTCQRKKTQFNTG